MCKFLFADIINVNTFRAFFKTGREMDPNFIYKIAFGFMPRRFTATPEDRYMYEEEGEVQEIYFIQKGDWAIGFNSYLRPNDLFSTEIDEELKGPEDMTNKGYLIASRRFARGLIGDYYALSEKRAQFHYLALTTVEAYALTTEFLINNIFTVFHGLHQDMLADAFCRYIKEFRKPCNKKRTELILKMNKKLHYSQIQSKNQ